MKKIHYAWIICFASMLLIFCNIGLCSNILAVYLPFIEERGISGSQGSSMVTVRCILAFLVTFPVSAFYGKLSLRTGAATATLIGAVSALVYAFAGNSMALYYIASGLSGISYTLGAMIPMSLLIENWFSERKGLAIGIATMGSGLSNVIFTPWVTSMVLSRGLRYSFLVQAGFTFVCALVILLIVRDEPSMMGLKKYGESTPAPERTHAAGATLRTEQKQRIGKLRILALFMMFLIGGAGQAGAGHISIVTTTSGYAAEQAAVIVTVYSVFLITGKFLCGVAADRLGSKVASLIFMIFAGTGCLCTCLMDGINISRAMAFACLMGFGYAVFNVGMPLWAADLSTPETFRKTLKNNQVMYSAGGIVFSSIPGIIADRTGEYRTAFVMVAVMMYVSAGILYFEYTAKEKQSRGSV